MLFEKAKQQLALEACLPFDSQPLRDALVKLRQLNEQTVDKVTIDKVISREFDDAAKEKAESLVRSFRDYIEQHRAEIEALQILYSRPFKQRLTEEGLKELEAKLKPEFGSHPVAALWHAYELTTENTDGTEKAKPKGNSLLPVSSVVKHNRVARFADLVSLVRFALEQEPVLEPFEDHVRQRFGAWLEEKRAAGTTFTADELAWLEKMRDYISASGSVDREHLEADNVLGPIYRAFGERLWPVMEELNLTLAA